MGETREGVTTANNELFLKLWYEVKKNTIDFGCTSQEEAVASTKKWFPHHKGENLGNGVGNCEYVINWANGGSEIMNYKDEKTGRIRSHNYNIDYNFREYATCSYRISSENVGLRYIHHKDFILIQRVQDYSCHMMFLNMAWVLYALRLQNHY